MLPSIERASVSGVPVLRAASPSGTNSAALTFRVGRFDEALPASGITHLVEHLALAATPPQRYQFNAEVSGLFTTFAMQSEDNLDVPRFVAAVCLGLTAAHQGRLEQEKRVLRTAALHRGGASLVATCLRERYGATGPGLLGYEEFGLHRLGWAEIEAWRSAWFTAANAVLCIVGELPAGLEVDLPAGQPRAAPSLSPLALDLPGSIVADAGGVGMSMTLPSMPSGPVTLDILERRLIRILRYDRGLTYRVGCIGQPLTVGLDHAWVAADALPDQIPMVAETMLATLEAIRDTGPADEELQDYAHRFRDSLQSADRGAALAVTGGAQRVLTHQPDQNSEQLLAQVAGVEPADVRQMASDLLSTAILAIPRPIPAIAARMKQLPKWSAATITGTEFRARSGARLTVGEAGVMLLVQPGDRVTVAAGEAAGLLRWNDGKRALIGRDGFVVGFDPAHWTDADLIRRSLESVIDPSAVIDIDEPGPATIGHLTGPVALAAQPARSARDALSPSPDAIAVPVRVSRTLSRRSRIIRSLWVLVAAGGLLAIANKDWGGLVFVVLGLSGVALQQVLAIRRLRPPR